MTEEQGQVPNVRFVRCPRCRNLLPEHPELSVYKCGGCGTVLQAKRKALVSGELLEKSEGEGDEMGSESKESFVVKDHIALGNASERESERIESVRKKETDFAEKIDLDSPLAVVDKEDSMSADKDVPNGSSLGEAIGGKVEQMSADEGIGGVDQIVTRGGSREILGRKAGESNADEDNGHAESNVVDGKLEQTSIDEDMGHAGVDVADGRLGREIMGGKVEQSSVDEDIGRADKAVESSKQKQPIGSGAEGDDDGITHRGEFVDLRIAKAKGKMKSKNGNASRFPWFLADLDTRKGEFEAIPKDFRKSEKQGKFSDFVYPDEGPSNYHLGYASGYDMKLRENDSIESARIKNLERDRVELLRKLDELKDQLSKPLHVAGRLREKVPIGENIVPLDAYGSHEKVRHQTLISEKQVPWPPYIDGSHGPVHSMNTYARDVQSFYHSPRFPIYPSNNLSEGQLPPHMVHRYPHPWHYPQRSFQDYHYPHPPLSSYPHDYPFHKPVCTDLHCSCQNWQKPLKFPPSSPIRKRFLNDPTHPNVHHPATYEPWSYSTGSANPHLHFQGPRSPHRRELRDDLHKLKRPVVIPEEIQHCHPVADGAPFIICCNCLALLKLPKKFINAVKDRQKLSCGSCLSIIVVETDNGRLVVSMLSNTKLESVKVNDGSVEVLSKNRLTSYGFQVSGGTRQGFSYPSSVYFKDEESPDSVLVQEKIVNSPELPLGDCDSPPVSESHLMDSNHELNRYALGNSSKHLERGERLHNMGGASRQNSMEHDFSLANEMDVTYNDYGDTSLSQDGTQVIKEEGRTKNKGNESFFSSFFKISLRDFSGSSRSVGKKKFNVSINGRRISDHDVRKAEKVAGEIRPGEYWYDYRAGFWGVMGQPCLGIIPPHIQEFNYPMPSDCGAGDTGVYVNGRELHVKDLEMLASRGLPTTPNKSYIIEISGRVVDEVSGLELDALGKIAPTVEKLNRGFGMRAIVG